MGNTVSDVEVVKAYCDAWLAGDVMTVVSLYHEDLTLDWPGQHHLAGTHVGQQASVEALLALQAQTDRTPIEVVDMLVGQDSVAAKVVERWSRPADDGETEVLEHTRILEFTVEDARLRTCRIYESAQPEIDEWLGSSRK